MSIVILGGNECMTRQYLDLCGKYKCKAKVYPKNVYRPAHLSRDMNHSMAQSILREGSYTCHSPEKCIMHLMSRLKGSGEFPHEIGLFLGYPPEDVCGFIENKPNSCKCVGLWKAYGDEKKAQQTFAKYRKCTDVYFRQWSEGKPLERLTVNSIYTGIRQ